MPKINANHFGMLLNGWSREQAQSLIKSLEKNNNGYSLNSYQQIEIWAFMAFAFQYSIFVDIKNENIREKVFEGFFDKGEVPEKVKNLFIDRSTEYFDILANNKIDNSEKMIIIGDKISNIVLDCSDIVFALNCSTSFAILLKNVRKYISKESSKLII